MDVAMTNQRQLRSRMYYEAIQDILPGVKVYIDTTGGGSIQKMLPLESFVPTADNGGN